MTLPPPTLPPGQPDPTWLGRLLIVQRICLALVMLISVTALSAGLYPPIGAALQVLGTQLSAVMALNAVLCTLSLALSEAGSAPHLRRFSLYLALSSVLLAAALLVQSYVHFSGVSPNLLDSGPPAATHSLSPQSALAFLVLSLVISFVRSDTLLARRISDGLVSCLLLVTFTLISQDIFGTLHLFGLTPSDLVSPQVLCSITLLAFVVVTRQAQFGVFSIFLGAGIGSRVARTFAPILFVWPFVREISEAHLSLPQLLPAHFASALLTSMAAAFSLAILLFIVWRINGMEGEIHDLTLRDELTGLYNMRGFYLLADQTFRLAQRAKAPFSVMFLDLDGLKKVNDHLGHNIGSAYLKKTGELIIANFRDADVKGRFGGDEFVVAGQFTMVGMEIAASRLKSLARELSSQVDPQFPLSFSIGYVTTEHYSTETLKDLVTRADEVMYEDKRSKRTART